MSRKIMLIYLHPQLRLFKSDNHQSLEVCHLLTILQIN